MLDSRPGSPGAGSHSIVVNLEPAVCVLMSYHRRRVFVDTLKGRCSAGFTVPESADAAEATSQAGLVAVRAAVRA